MFEPRSKTTPYTTSFIRFKDITKRNTLFSTFNIGHSLLEGHIL